jgi:hypothetical protein
MLFKSSPAVEPEHPTSITLDRATAGHFHTAFQKSLVPWKEVLCRSSVIHVCLGIEQIEAWLIVFDHCSFDRCAPVHRSASRVGFFRTYEGKRHVRFAGGEAVRLASDIQNDCQKLRTSRNRCLEDLVGDGLQNVLQC